MGVIPKPRKHVATGAGDPQALDAQIVAVLAERGAMTGVELVARLKATPLRDTVDRLAVLVARDRVRHDGRRFSLRVNP